MPKKGLNYGYKLITFAQNNEDIMLYGYFQQLSSRGFYVDIGANHPVHDSVTKFFHLRGWNGINIEPLTHLHKLLEIDRPRDINLAVGISDKPGVETIRQYKNDGLSTFSESLKKSHEKFQQQYTDIKIPLKTLAAVLSKHAANKQIHFLKVDIEGYEYKALVGNDWKRFRPWVVCIEATGEDKRWKDVLKRAKYTQHLFDGLNEFYVAEEHAELVRNYRTVVSSGVIRYDIANMPTLKIRQGVRETARLIKQLKTKK